MQATEQLGAGVLVSTLGTIIMRVRIYGMDRKTSIVGAVPYLLCSTTYIPRTCLGTYLHEVSGADTG